MKLWLDDIREPPSGSWHWAKNFEEAVKAMLDGVVAFAQLDHDLSFEHYANWHAEQEGTTPPVPQIEKTGYDFCKWMAEHDIWPTEGCVVHSWNGEGARKMCGVIDRYGPYDTPCPYIPAKT